MKQYDLRIFLFSSQQVKLIGLLQELVTGLLTKQVDLN